jgi:excinuclease ABC subunit C
VLDRPLTLAGVGLGAAREAALLDAFGSYDAVAGASIDQLTMVRGIGPSLANRIHAAMSRRAQ